jgi:hypothetical protein
MTAPAERIEMSTIIAAVGVFCLCMGVGLFCWAVQDLKNRPWRVPLALTMVSTAVALMTIKAASQ